MPKFKPRRLISEKERYLRVFWLGFIILLLVMLPIMIYNKGYFTYYGDFNAQQLPFYYHSHDLIRTDGIGWDWQTDLGANFIGSYSFYLFGSPFFWLTLPFPSRVVPYLIPWLLCLKHATATVTAYAFLRRFVRSHTAATIGAILYAYSGFQLYNIFFNHFQDVTAFFPLLLIALEERVNNNRRGWFTLIVGLMASINYFFFAGQVVFVLAYFIFRCFCPDFHVTWRKFFGIALESVLGVMLSAALLLPSALAVMGNYRVNERLSGQNMLLYSDSTRIWRIIQSFFMLPDPPARTNLFSSENAKWSSIAGYLPLFSMVGVCAFWRARRKHWATRLTVFCAFCAMVPVLNSMFYAFNSAYYARWFYMPILIFCLMTAISLDDPDISLTPGIRVTGVALFLFLLMAFVPKAEDGYHLLPNDPGHFFRVWAICVASLLAVWWIWRKKVCGKPYQKFSLYLTGIATLVCTISMIATGLWLGPYPHQYINQAIEGGDSISLLEAENQFYRIDVSENIDNYAMFWGYSNMRCFQSVVPASIMEFYDALGITRDVASRVETSHYTLRGLLSVQYYFDETDVEIADRHLLPGFTFMNRQNGFNVYENEAYVPMGYTFQYYAQEEDAKDHSDTNVERLLIKAILLNAEQEEKYGDYLQLIPPNAAYGLGEDDYLSECEKRAASACDSFRYDSHGFEAGITLDAPNLVFFSVPYEDGWTATVNGEPVDVERVDFGFMAVLAQAGENEIVFTYKTPGLNTGLLISGCGLVVTLTYLWLGLRLKKRDDLRMAPHTVYFDYASSQPDIHTAYMTQLLAMHSRTEEAAQETPPEQPKQ